MLRLKFVENLRMFYGYSKAHIQISIEICVCTYMNKGDFGYLN